MHNPEHVTLESVTLFQNKTEGCGGWRYQAGSSKRRFIDVVIDDECYHIDNYHYYYYVLLSFPPDPLTMNQSGLIQACATLTNSTAVGLPAMRRWCGLDLAEVALELRHSRRLCWKWNTATGTSMGPALKNGNTGETGLGSEGLSM